MSNKNKSRISIRLFSPHELEWIVELCNEKGLTYEQRKKLYDNIRKIEAKAIVIEEGNEDCSNAKVISADNKIISFEEYAKQLECEFLIEKRTNCSKSHKNPIEDVETINHPSHYNQVPGIECIDVVSHFSFTIGNIIKYCWRAGSKHNTTKLEDLKKAKWYIEYAIEQEEKLQNG